MFVDYAKFYDQFYKDKPYKKEIEFVYRWAGAPKRILDCGCGTAHYWQYYPDSVAVIGVEKSRGMMKNSANQGLIFQRDIHNGEFYGKDYDLVTALFDVMNYLPDLGCFTKAPVKQGGYLIFDMWDSKKVKGDGFRKTEKIVGPLKRTINPRYNGGRMVNLEIQVEARGIKIKEVHTMYIHTEEDVRKKLGNEFEIVEIKPTENWQQWWKLRKK